jgi:hypothetical protein
VVVCLVRAAARSDTHCCAVFPNRRLCRERVRIPLQTLVKRACSGSRHAASCCCSTPSAKRSSSGVQLRQQEPNRAVQLLRAVWGCSQSLQPAVQRQPCCQTGGGVTHAPPNSQQQRDHGRWVRLLLGLAGKSSGKASLD